MKRILISMFVMMLLIACATQPVANFEQQSIPVTLQKLPLENIGDLIIEGGHVRKWTFDRVGSGHLVAKQISGNLSATVDVFFDQTKYSLVYKSSTGFSQDGAKISRHYNLWVRNLNKDIESRLAIAADRSLRGS